MPNKKRCKRQREAKLHAAALNVPKLSSFDFTNITQGNLQENNREDDFESVSEPSTSTEDIISTCISPVNNDSGTSSDDDNSNSLVVDIVQESATDSNEENYFAVADDPDCSETKSDSFSVFPAIFVPNESDETTLESELRDTFVPESTPTCSTECSNAPSPGMDPA